ncbi:1300013D05Rik protein, putative [Trichomonas vaginalis G3]|uniref:1300013D05Rik protein, putative n=1 Tax=Trichomonas vaginalis (strain ATCC PRA-98 / G3) TaxID=412133 RepID=A2FV05_TRIV3|nr:RNA splicing [Trichomonas vaginalis G3]EAX91267.1 1300013D05Rik protein, putative [Trichomonas vaginalis G3]KAI5491808.1 RNA splicing [Trichomonas vaginalis G3]|eukprot:XP_001304197.1 1300013D05Rik protein [Trichomonas vaginalis G3]
MSMKFLSKKRFHPRRLDNIRKVAEAEAKYKEEQTRMAELRREREEEKDLEELRKAQEASGRIEKTTRRLEWIYKAPIIQKKGDEDEEDEVRVNPLLEKQRPDAILQEKRHAQMTQNNLPGAKFLMAVNEYKGDKDMKLREDPFTAIFNKKREEELRKAQEQKLIEQAELIKNKNSRSNISQLYPSDDDGENESELKLNRKNTISRQEVNKKSDQSKDYNSSDSSSDSSHNHHRHSHHHHHHHHSRH